MTHELQSRYLTTSDILNAISTYTEIAFKIFSNIYHNHEIEVQSS